MTRYARKRVILLVLDSLGVGAMDDVFIDRPQDVGANTLKHVAEAVGGLNTPTLARLGLGCIEDAPGLALDVPPLASYGRANLGYRGADSYLGHQSLLGTIPLESESTLMVDAADEIRLALVERGHDVQQLDGGVLVVDEAVVIADNLEADKGLNINLTVALAEITFEKALEIGAIVRHLVKVARVIVFGGSQLTLKEILAQLERRSNGQVGINSPALGVYDSHLVVRHIGYGVDPNRQVASIAANAGMRVSLVGKMADLIVCPQAARNAAVPTTEVMQAIIDGTRDYTFDFLAATVQETDLAGHEGDPTRYAAALKQADDGIAALLPLLAPGDTLIVTADHGNDPTRSTGKHTREQVPILVYRPGLAGRPFPVRTSLADIAATSAALLGLPVLAEGTSIFDAET
jgi:phosphopentomutase